MPDIDKTKNDILEIFKRDDVSAPEALFMMSVIAARVIVGSCSSMPRMKATAEKYFCDVVEAMSATPGACDCLDCRKHLN